MGKHFRIIEGGRVLRKDGLNERGQKSRIPLHGVTAREPTYPSYGRPALDDRSFKVKTVSGRLWIKPSRFDGQFLWGMLVAPAVMFFAVWNWTAPVAAPVGIASAASSSSDTESASFGFCHSGGGTNCVVDGDTIYYQGTKIRIADIDTPETHDAKCTAEQERGDAATQRMIQLVNAGPFSLGSIDRDEDRYGRKLRVVTRGGTSLGGVLVGEGLARYYEGGRRSWC
jgi:micrococcal nuclease